jgi:hypothetical protein
MRPGLAGRDASPVLKGMLEADDIVTLVCARMATTCQAFMAFIVTTEQSGLSASLNEPYTLSVQQERVYRLDPSRAACYGRAARPEERV